MLSILLTIVTCRFESLVDREWLRAGHPFAERNIKVGVSPTKYKGQGPVFLLFLDCVWQVSAIPITSFGFARVYRLYITLEFSNFLSQFFDGGDFEFI